jgi:pSer/pThr/pTyr-binding forkhead associated (FHA) protein
MFSRFNKTDETAPDVKAVRDKLRHFIKEQLQQWQGGEGRNIRSIQLYLFCNESEKSMFESAVYISEEGRFKETELQRIIDDYALDLPEEWNFEIAFAPAPPNAAKATDLPAALVIATRQKKIAAAQQAKAYVQVLQGETEQARYGFDAQSGKITIGRDRMVQAADGFHRENKIAFIAASTNEANKFVSRQHAHIEWSEEAGAFLLFADEGGIPPRNKVKVRPHGGEPVKLQSTHVGYTLHPGDQIMLGDTALLEFGFEA